VVEVIRSIEGVIFCVIELPRVRTRILLAPTQKTN
jgi:hypothetical protein